MLTSHHILQDLRADIVLHAPNPPPSAWLIERLDAAFAARDAEIAPLPPGSAIERNFRAFIGLAAPVSPKRLGIALDESAWGAAASQRGAAALKSLVTRDLVRCLSPGRYVLTETGSVQAERFTPGRIAA